jgi:O-antigen ligase
MAESAGWRGYGPGTFKLLFPHTPAMEPSLYYKYIVREYVPGQPVSMWSHVHDDYLQSLIEWGWPGTALWVALFAGGLFTVARAASRSPVDRRCAVAVAIALGGVLLHALIDFPLQVEVIRFDVAALLGLAWSADEWSGTRRTARDPA